MTIPDRCDFCGATPCEHYPSPQLELFPIAMRVMTVEFRCPGCGAEINAFEHWRCACGLAGLMSGAEEHVIKTELIDLKTTNNGYG